MIVRQTFFFGDVGDHIFPETVHTHIKPEAQNLFDFFPDQGIVHIQIRLFDREQVKVIFAPDLIPGPGFALKITVPVVRELAARLGRPPNVVICIRFDPLTAFLEPVVLVAGVVDHQVHYKFHAPLMTLLQNLPEGFHAAKFRGDIHVVGNIVTAVCAGRRVDGGEPNAIAA